MKYFLVSFFLTIFLGTLNSQEIEDMDFHIPTKGKLASMYGWRTQRNNFGIKEKKFHRGVDIAGKYGEAIYASEAGEVVFVGTNGGYGKYIEIKHNERYSTCYCHLKKFCVSKGDTVIVGEKIAEMGNSGTTFSTIGGKGIHLHFEIRDDTKTRWDNPKGTTNPLKLLKNYSFLSKYDFVEFQYQPEMIESHKAKLLPIKVSINNILTQKDYKLLNKPDILISRIEAITSLRSNDVEIKNLKLIDNSFFKNNQISYSNFIESKEIESTFYSIQIVANDKELTKSEIESIEKKYDLSGLFGSEVIINGKRWYKYTVGEFENMEEAKLYKSKLYNSNSIKNAAICYFKDNKITKTYW